MWKRLMEKISMHDPVSMLAWSVVISALTFLVLTCLIEATN